MDNEKLEHLAGCITGLNQMLTSLLQTLPPHQTDEIAAIIQRDLNSEAMNAALGDEHPTEKEARLSILEGYLQLLRTSRPST